MNVFFKYIIEKQAYDAVSPRKPRSQTFPDLTTQHTDYGTVSCKNVPDLYTAWKASKQLKYMKYMPEISCISMLLVVCLTYLKLMANAIDPIWWNIWFSVELVYLTKHDAKIVYKTMNLRMSCYVYICHIAGYATWFISWVENQNQRFTAVNGTILIWTFYNLSSLLILLWSVQWSAYFVVKFTNFTASLIWRSALKHTFNKFSVSAVDVNGRPSPMDSLFSCRTDPYNLIARLQGHFKRL